LNEPEILALIPARGGSKSIPRKNVVPYAGKPLICWTIEQARACARITRIVVSTDDDEIAAVARGAGAEVPFRRPSEIAGDLSPDIETFAHALGWLAREQGYACELVVHLRATCPLRTAEHIGAAIDLMLRHPEADSLRSVSVAQQTPYKMWRAENGWLRPLIGLDGLREAHSMPRQLLPTALWHNGYIDIIRPRAILAGSMTGERVLAFMMSEPTYDIDHREDLAAAERALRARSETPDAGPPAPRPSA
jgi:N-acylneuraminate cytidylyltransferase